MNPKDSMVCDNCMAFLMRIGELQLENFRLRAEIDSQKVRETCPTCLGRGKYLAAKLTPSGPAEAVEVDCPNCAKQEGVSK